VDSNHQSYRSAQSTGTQPQTAIAQLALEAEWWARQHNIEALWCWLPTFEQVCDNVHIVTALGNDAMAVNVVVDNDVAAMAAGRGGEQVQLAYLGRFLAQIRREEVARD
jgi:hypothetical protein